jgi:hypothetical protein
MATHEWNPRLPCPLCGAINECATNVAGHQAPKPGSVIICFSCGLTMMLGNDRRLRVPTAAERQELDRDPDIQRLLRAHREMKEKRAN